VKFYSFNEVVNFEYLFNGSVGIEDFNTETIRQSK